MRYQFGIYGPGMHDFVLRELEIGFRAAVYEDMEAAGFSALDDVALIESMKQQELGAVRTNKISEVHVFNDNGSLDVIYDEKTADRLVLTMSEPSQVRVGRRRRVRGDDGLYRPATNEKIFGKMIKPCTLAELCTRHRHVIVVDW